MKQQVTRGIVVARTTYGEADRIITFLTPDHGKLHLMARGVRKLKSKLAGGVELFSVSHITFARGRGDIGTLVSARLDEHFGRIVGDIQRAKTGYECILEMDRLTEDELEEGYFVLMREVFAALDDPAVPPLLTQLWFYARMLTLDGHAPNLLTDADGAELRLATGYDFRPPTMSFIAAIGAPYKADDIKFLRLVFGSTRPAVLARIDRAEELAPPMLKLLQRIVTHYIL